jgi:RNase P subunit RPR2
VGTVVLVKHKVRLLLDKNPASFERVVCTHCGSLLFKAKNFLSKSCSDSVRPFQVEIKCQKCHEINLF